MIPEQFIPEEGFEKVEDCTKCLKFADGIGKLPVALAGSVVSTAGGATLATKKDGRGLMLGSTCANAESRDSLVHVSSNPVIVPVLVAN